MLIVFLGTLVLVVGLGRFDYRMTVEGLWLRWRILGFVPFWSWRIAHERVAGLRPFHRRDVLTNAIIFGRVPSQNACIVELKSGRFRRVYITPRDQRILAAAFPSGPLD